MMTTGDHQTGCLLLLHVFTLLFFDTEEVHILPL